jgi:hypothetical protein
MHEIHVNLFERTISNLLANGSGFTDSTIQAIENLKSRVLDFLPAEQ